MESSRDMEMDRVFEPSWDTENDVVEDVLFVADACWENETDAVNGDENESDPLAVMVGVILSVMLSVVDVSFDALLLNENSWDSDPDEEGVSE